MFPFHRRELRRRATPAVLFLIALLAATAAQALVPPRVASAPAAKSYRDPDLFILDVARPPEQLAPALAAQARADLAVLGVEPGHGFFDQRTGRWATLILRRPLIPGPGAGNTLAWADLGTSPPASSVGLGRAAWNALVGYLALYEPQLRIDPDQLDPDPAITVHDGGRIVQIAARQMVGGVPVRDSLLTATLNAGNLVLLGTRNWGDVSIATTPLLTSGAALAKVQALTPQLPIDGLWKATELVVIPLEQGDDPALAAPGHGLRHALAWAVHPSYRGEQGTWEGLIDAASGKLIAFQDQNQYAASRRQVQGGVFPVSNDQQPPDGVEAAGYPMPFADVTLPEGGVTFTNGAGLLGCVDGSISTGLAGTYVRMTDTCGAAAESSSDGVLDLGTGGGTDCAVPAGHSAGDTHASRSGFYELNRLMETARGWLPDNPWLRSQLTANMNIVATCNANWNGVAVNFYRAGDGCRNTGEIAAVFDHEWGHGLDANDNTGTATGTVSSPGEAIADTYAMLRLHTSCIGRGFRADDSGCGGYGDPCTSCSGVRDVDFARHASGEPHDIDWINNPPILPGGGCIGYVSGQVGPCGQETHCEGMVPAEAAYDLVARDLQAAPYGFDADTAFEVGSRLFFLGAGNVINWYQCLGGDSGLGGCNADGGYLNLLATDDDNGDLLDGTPHMRAIFNAFDRHQIACAVPQVADSGCAGSPAAAPTLAVQPLVGGARLSWTAVAGARRYWVFRTEGVNGCAFGKVKIAETAATSYDDLGLRPGFAYSYGVMAVGDGDSCTGAMSDCAAVRPAAGADLGVAANSARVVGLTGDGDPFLDDCETAEVRFTVENTGSVGLTNVRLVGAESISHPATEVTSALPAAVAPSLGSCESATGAFTVRAGGLAFDDTVRFRVDLTSDEIFPAVRSQVVELIAAESDLQPEASRSFDFDAVGDLAGWRVTHGTYRQLPGGPTGSTAFLASSAAEDNTCDRVSSPLLRLAPTSTLSLQNNFTIEPPVVVFDNVFYDRANVGLLDAASGVRTTVSPDGGRLYNASGPNGSCVTSGEPGWADAMPTWAESSWSAAALQSAAQAGKLVRLDVAYGTDPQVSLGGFWFDEVTLTDVDVQVPDAQSDVCSGLVALDDAATTAADTPVAVDVLANDSTPNPPLTVTAVGEPPHGTATDDGGGTVTYRPDPGFTGTDAFSYTAEDGGGDRATATVTVVVVEAGGGSGEVHGSGWLAGDPNGKIHFSFDARPDGSGGLRGRLQVSDKAAGVEIDGGEILDLSAGQGDCDGAAPGPGSFELTASGSINGEDGAKFRACGEDLGNPGQGADRFYVECLSGCGYDTASRTADDVLDGGNLHVHPPLPGASGAAAATNSTATGGTVPQVLDLDPILLTSAPVGAPQLLVAVVQAEEGLDLEGRPVTLSWTAGDGSTGTASAVTDALGVALFVTTVGPGETEYTVSTGDLGSNGIAVTGTVGLP